MLFSHAGIQFLCFCNYKVQYQITAANAFFLPKTHWTIRSNKSDKILIYFLCVLNLKVQIKRMNKQTID